jgi:hypothetical protein
VVSRNTNLVIEGTESSANTFAVMAFRLTQTSPVRVAHHLHAAAQVAAAVQLGIPTLAIIRNPEDVCVSRVIRHPPLSPREALREYVCFYKTVYDCDSRLVVATFDQVIGDFGDVTARVNKKFGTRFQLFDHTQENVQRVFDLIERRYQLKGYKNVTQSVAHPSQARGEETKAQVVSAYRDPTLLPLREKAELLYAAALGSAF